MAIAIVAVAIICIGSVSAADETVDINLTVDDNSQAISELNGRDDIDDAIMEEGNVDVKTEDTLGASEEDKLLADSTLTLVSGSTTPNVGDTVYLRMSNEASTYLYDFGQTVYIRNGGTDYATTTYRTAISDAGAPVTFSSEGTYSIQFCVFTNSENYYTNTITFTVSEGSGSGESQTSTQEYPDGSDGSAIPEYYIRIFELDGERFVDVKYVDSYGSQSYATTDLATMIYNINGQTTFPSSVYPGFASSTQVVYNDDGTNPDNYQYYKYIVTNGTDYSSWSSYTRSNYVYNFASDDGAHRAYSYYTYNGVTYYSNVFYVYGVDISQKTSTPTLRLYDKKNPTNTTVIYNIGDNVSVINSLSDAIFGSQLADHIYTRTVEGTEYILENIDIYLNGELLYSHGEGSLYSLKGDGILVNLNDNTTNGFNLYLDHAGWYNLTAKYYGNTLGLNGATSEILSIYVPSQEEEDIQVNVEISLDKTSVSKDGTITITPTVTGGSNDKGIVEFYDENNVKLGEIDLKTNSTFTFTATGEAGSAHSVYAVYTDANTTYPQANSSKIDYKIKGVLTINLARDDEGLVKPGDTVSFTITYSESVTDNLELWYNGAMLFDLDDLASTSIKFDETDIGLNNVTIKFFGNDDYDACESNVVQIRVVEPVETTVSLTLNTTEVRINGKILVTAHVYDKNGNEITDGNVKVYKTSSFYNEDPIATIKAGENFELTVDSNSFSTYQNPYKLYSQYVGITTDDNIYAASSNTSGTTYYHVLANTITLTPSENNIYVGQSVDVTVDVNGNGVITLFVNGVENTTLSKGTTTFNLTEAKDYEFQAFYTMTTGDYYASCVSEKITVHVSEANAPIVEISLDKTSVSKDGTITITPTVTGGSNDKGIVEFYDENNVKLGEIDLKTNSTFTFTATGEAGSAHSVYAKYIDSNTAFPQASSDKKEYKIKGVLTITLARDGEGLVKPGNTVNFIITFSDEISQNIELWVNDTKIGNENGYASTSVTFNSSYIGSNNVFIKFLGNDDYEACVSNNVTVDVIKPLTTTMTIELSSSEVIPGKNITIAPKVLDENGNEVTIGVVRIYDNMFANNDPIATINAGGTANFTDLVNYAGTVHYLYAKYAGADSEDASYEASPVSEGVSYTVVSDNRIELTASEYNIYAGQSVDITAVVNGNGVITLKINGEDNTTLTKDEAKSFTLNEVGEYTFVATYTRGTDYYISAVSEPITVHVAEKPVQNEITVSVEDVALPGNATVIVTALVDGIYTIDVNQTPVTVNVVGGKGNNTIKLSAGEYYANVTGHEDAKITNAVFKVSPEPKVGELIIRDATYPQNATIELSGEGNVTIYVEYYLVKPLDGATTERITFNVGGNNKFIENLINGSYTGAFSFVVNQTGEFTVNASYYGWKLMEGGYSFASENILKYSVTIKELPTDEKKNISLTVLVDEDEDDYVEADWTETFEIETYASDDISGVIIYREGETELGRANIGEVFELNASTLGLGEHNITAIFEGNDSYNPANRTFTIDVAKKIIWYTLQIDDVTFPDHAVGMFYGESVDGKYTITINGTDYTVEFEWYVVDGTVSFNITKLPAGSYKVSSVKYEDMEHYEIGETTIEGLNTFPTFEVKAGEVTLDDNVLTVSNGSAPTFSIDLENATGSLSVKVGNNTYTTELVNGKATVEITDLPAGNHEATVTFNSTNDNYRSSSIQTSFNVKPKDVPDVNTTLNVDVPSDSLNPVFTFNLPNATGNLTVTIGDKKYTKELVNGTATIAVDDLLPGSYNATVTYSGDKNHEGISKNTTFTVPTPKLTGKNVAVIYSAAASYKVLVTVNGKALAGEKVTVKFNGKSYSLTTDKNGYATLKLNTKVKVKKYTINVEYKGVKASNALTVKHLIKAKNIKAKKSKRVLKIKVSTNKVNGKFLKGKKLTLKVKGKTLKAKINKKGVATFKVKKSILNKLKVGKKYKYKVSYGKDSVTKKITVRR